MCGKMGLSPEQEYWRWWYVVGYWLYFKGRINRNFLTGWIWRIEKERRPGCVHGAWPNHLYGQNCHQLRWKLGSQLERRSLVPLGPVTFEMSIWHPAGLSGRWLEFRREVWVTDTNLGIVGKWYYIDQGPVGKKKPHCNLNRRSLC